MKRRTADFCPTSHQEVRVFENDQSLNAFLGTYAVRVVAIAVRTYGQLIVVLEEEAQ